MQQEASSQTQSIKLKEIKRFKDMKDLEKSVISLAPFTVDEEFKNVLSKASGIRNLSKDQIKEFFKRWASLNKIKNIKNLSQFVTFVTKDDGEIVEIVDWASKQSSIKFPDLVEFIKIYGKLYDIQHDSKDEKEAALIQKQLVQYAKQVITSMETMDILKKSGKNTASMQGAGNASSFQQKQKAVEGWEQFEAPPKTQVQNPQANNAPQSPATANKVAYALGRAQGKNVGGGFNIPLQRTAPQAPNREQYAPVTELKGDLNAEKNKEFQNKYVNQIKEQTLAKQDANFLLRLRQQRYEEPEFQQERQEALKEQFEEDERKKGLEHRLKMAEKFMSHTIEEKGFEEDVRRAFEIAKQEASHKGQINKMKEGIHDIKQRLNRKLTNQEKKFIKNQEENIKKNHQQQLQLTNLKHANTLLQEQNREEQLRLQTEMQRHANQFEGYATTALKEIAQLTQDAKEIKREQKTTDIMSMYKNAVGGYKQLQDSQKFANAQRYWQNRSKDLDRAMQDEDHNFKEKRMLEDFYDKKFQNVQYKRIRKLQRRIADLQKQEQTDKTKDQIKNLERSLAQKIKDAEDSQTIYTKEFQIQTQEEIGRLYQRQARLNKVNYKLEDIKEENENQKLIKDTETEFKKENKTRNEGNRKKQLDKALEETAELLALIEHEKKVDEKMAEINASKKSIGNMKRNQQINKMQVTKTNLDEEVEFNKKWEELQKQIDGFEAALTTHKNTEKENAMKTKKSKLDVAISFKKQILKIKQELLKTQEEMEGIALETQNTSLKQQIADKLKKLKKDYSDVSEKGKTLEEKITEINELGQAKRLQNQLVINQKQSAENDKLQKQIDAREAEKKHRIEMNKIDEEEENKKDQRVNKRKREEEEQKTEKEIKGYQKTYQSNPFLPKTKEQQEEEEREKQRKEAENEFVEKEKSQPPPPQGILKNTTTTQILSKPNEEQQPPKKGFFEKTKAIASKLNPLTLFDKYRKVAQSPTPQEQEEKPIRGRTVEVNREETKTVSPPIQIQKKQQEEQPKFPNTSTVIPQIPKERQTETMAIEKIPITKQKEEEQKEQPKLEARQPNWQDIIGEHEKAYFRKPKQISKHIESFPGIEKQEHNQVIQSIITVPESSFVSKRGNVPKLKGILQEIELTPEQIYKSLKEKKEKLEKEKSNLSSELSKSDKYRTANKVLNQKPPTYPLTNAAQGEYNISLKKYKENQEQAGKIIEEFQEKEKQLDEYTILIKEIGRTAGEVMDTGIEVNKLKRKEAYEKEKKEKQQKEQEEKQKKEYEERKRQEEISSQQLNEEVRPQQSNEESILPEVTEEDRKALQEEKAEKQRVEQEKLDKAQKKTLSNSIRAQSVNPFKRYTTKQQQKEAAAKKAKKQGAQFNEQLSHVVVSKTGEKHIEKVDIIPNYPDQIPEKPEDVEDLVPLTVSEKLKEILKEKISVEEEAKEKQGKGKKQKVERNTILPRATGNINTGINVLPKPQEEVSKLEKYNDAKITKAVQELEQSSGQMNQESEIKVNPAKKTQPNPQQGLNLAQEPKPSLEQDIHKESISIANKTVLEGIQSSTTDYFNKGELEQKAPSFDVLWECLNTLGFMALFTQENLIKEADFDQYTPQAVYQAVLNKKEQRSEEHNRKWYDTFDDGLSEMSDKIKTAINNELLRQNRIKESNRQSSLSNAYLEIGKIQTMANSVVNAIKNSIKSSWIQAKKQTRETLFDEPPLPGEQSVLNTRSSGAMEEKQEIFDLDDQIAMFNKAKKKSKKE